MNSSSSSRVVIRSLCTSQKLLNAEKKQYTPAFLKTISNATKSPLRQSIAITRPIGLERPTIINSKHNSFQISGIFKELFGSEAKERRRESVDYDLKHSLFYEAKSFTNTKGKIFTPPISYFKKEKAKYFPNFIAHPLIGPETEFYQSLKGKVSIVRMFSKQSAFDCVKTYFETNKGDLATDKYSEFLSQHSKSQIIDITLPNRWYEGYFLKKASGSILKKLPIERKDKYFILPLSEFPYSVRQQLVFEISTTGYIYVVDQDGKIRWCTSGNANPEELAFLNKCISKLEQELDQSQVNNIEEVSSETSA
ncbi:Atp10 protein [Scheffersomyces amazonensis]|uniref:Atp10 protein n=1 Tax=Scheffersomyces amazonensis TaxID=1078765 RepID=UPI00315DCC62